MTTLGAERLYGLLPQVHRLADAEQGYPLRDLLALFARELEAIEENVEQLYDDQFIETCADWVAPYIGDLIGYRPLHGATPAVASPRAEVANTIAYRRRKGTALMLEQLARDLTGWPAHVAEFFEQLATTQYMKHLRPQAPAAAAVRSPPAMLAVDGASRGAFNTTAHTAEMRRPEAGAGRYGIPNVGIFLWRLQAYPITRVPLVPHPGDATNTMFRVNPLGADLRLFRRRRTEDAITHLSEPINVPAPLSVREMARAVKAAQALVQPDGDTDDDYGDNESVRLWRPGVAPGRWDPVPTAEIVVADLRDVAAGWNHAASVPAGRIAIDPERGRVLLGAGVAGPLRASFHYGFSRPIGGGEYERTPDGETLALQNSASEGQALQPLLDALAPAGGRLTIADSLTYAETPVFRVAGVTAAGAPGLEVVVCAHDGARPLIDASADVVLDIGPRGRLVLDGLVIQGGPLTLANDGSTEPREIVLRDCTLVPGRRLNPDGSALAPGAPSLIVLHPYASVTLERCIAGALQVTALAETSMVDCIVDAGGFGNEAYAGDTPAAPLPPQPPLPGAPLTVQQCTVIGKVRTQVMTLASNTLFGARRVAGDGWRAPVWAERTQQGCVRFCWLPPDAIVPRRHRCLPSAGHPGVQAQWTSLRYGDAGYMQLRSATPEVIRTGAGDAVQSADETPAVSGEGGEIGVMHALYQPQRESNLRVRLDEYLRFGLHAGVFYVT